MSYQFEQGVNRALVAVKRILDTTRTPQLPDQVPHAYADKFLLTEFLCNTALASTL
jgi:hypothetical protein